MAVKKAAVKEEAKPEKVIALNVPRDQIMAHLTKRLTERRLQAADLRYSVLFRYPGDEEQMRVMRLSEDESLFLLGELREVGIEDANATIL